MSGAYQITPFKSRACSDLATPVAANPRESTSSLSEFDTGTTGPDRLNRNLLVARWRRCVESRPSDQVLIATNGRPEFDPTFRDSSRDGRTHSDCAAKRLVLGEAPRPRRPSRPRPAASGARCQNGLRRCVARPDILLFRDGVSLPKGLIASGQILLQVVREPGCKIFPLRIGDLAPLQDRQNLILDDVIPGVRAQLGNRA